jgi:hypothetical protein
MRRIITLFGVAVTAMSTSAILAATASAAEPTKILPEPTAGAPLTTSGSQPGSGGFLTVGGLEVKCAKGSGGSTWTSANSGTGEVLFTECTGPLSTTCTGEGDATGLISAKGEVLFWLALLMTGTVEKPTSELIAAIATLLEAGGVKFTCVNAKKTIEDKIVVKGCGAAQVLPASLNKLISEAKGESAEWTTGETKVLSILKPEATVESPCLPKISTNGGAEELAAGTGLANATTFKKGGAAITIELMNP